MEKITVRLRLAFNCVLLALAAVGIGVLMYFLWIMRKDDKFEEIADETKKKIKDNINSDRAWLDAHKRKSIL